ncbi:hypothetical protein [Nocardioides sp.]|uniref:hypothetical protein n=1 Tax=Nocardioides sp. TaxID=35761 RepID=UPI003218E127
MQLLAQKAAEGIGLTMGEDIGQELSSLAANALDRVKAALDSEPDETLFGYAPGASEAEPWGFVGAGIAPDDNGLGEKNFRSAMSVDFSGYSLVVPSIFALGFFHYTSLLFNEAIGGKSGGRPQHVRVYESIRAAYAIDVYEASEGDLVTTKPCTIEAITNRGRNLQVEWDPTFERTEQSRLIVREGIRLKGEDAQWDRVEKWGIPSHKLWDLAS